jgi:hypothetical protein
MKLHNWMVTHWIPATAFVYTAVCLCDFIIFPIYVGILKENTIILLESISHLPPLTQLEIIRLDRVSWDPLTLKGGGLFHLAYGALLTSGGLKGKAIPTGIRRIGDDLESGSRVD